VIVDSSAVVAILCQEREAAAFAQAIEEASDVAISASTLLETSIVMKPRYYGSVDELISAMRIRIVPFDARQAEVARAAHALYGKGSRSPAHLNYGDCMAYALAKVTGQPLLFKGDDFTHTDITPAI
jgi:ribonuclease VapC